MTSRTVHANCTGSSFSFYLAILSFLCFLSACQTVTEETLRANVLDAAINTAVKSKILADPVVSKAEVSVETVRGHVYLRGVVRKADDKRRAQELANEVPGGLTVVNQLKVQEIQNL